MVDGRQTVRDRLLEGAGAVRGEPASGWRRHGGRRGDFLAAAAPESRPGRETGLIYLRQGAVSG